MKPTLTELLLAVGGLALSAAWIAFIIWAVVKGLSILERLAP